jgi:hypothetical protein
MADVMADETDSIGHFLLPCDKSALAARLGVKLVTEDRTLLQAFPMLAVGLAQA